MAKIQNIFAKGIVNLDDDERFVSSDEMIDSENFIVTSTNGSNGGVGKNVPGNLKKTSYNIPGAKTIGEGADYTGEKVYNLIVGTLFDYIIEYNISTNTSVIVLQDTKGRVLKFDKNKRVLNVNIIFDAEGGGNLIAFSGDANPPRIFNIERAKTWGTNNFSDGDISVMKPSPIFSPNIVMTTSIDGIENNFLDDKFLVFAYRYKYADNFYSAPSSWSKLAFQPSLFRLDYQTSENNGMINLSNAVDITFETGPRDVVEVDLLFRESNSSIVYVIQNFNKANEGWSNNLSQIIQLSKSKIYSVLSEEQYFRNFDNVPLQTTSQTLIGNRIAYANYIEGRDLGVVINFDVTYTSQEAISDALEADSLDFVDEILTYSNVVDFEEGNVVGGSAPVNQMDYATNTMNVDLTGDPDNALFYISVSPTAGYSAIQYDIIVKNGAITIESLLNVSGNQTLYFTRTTNGNIKIYIISNEGLIYNLDLNYRLIFFLSTVSDYKYFAYNQLSYPKSGGYGANLVGDTVIDRIAEFDLQTIQFKKGKQIRINFELKSSLVNNFNPSVTFFYNITQDYLNSIDFITNSSFVTQLQDVFSENFRLNEISNEGVFVSYDKFSVSLVGNILYITTPKVVYSVTEPSGITENKDEFYLVTESQLFTTTENAFSSMHSNRDYEGGLIYMDGQGRKSTVLVDKDNAIYIPASASDKINTLNFTINNPPPSWAKYYKFAIKQTKRNYETIYGNIVYKDGIYRWIKLIGENKDKVSEGTILIVKADYAGPLETLTKTRVLEIVDQPENFISGNLLTNGEEIVEESGLYMKIKQGNFDINITDESYQSFIGTAKARYASRGFVATVPYFGVYNGATFEPIPVKAGSVIRFYVNLKAFGAIAFDHTCEILVTAQEDYANVQLWWEAEIQNQTQWINFQNDYLLDYKFDIDGRNFQVKPWRDGTASRDIITNIKFDINFSGGNLVFETEALEQLQSSFFETPETFTIINGLHQFVTHVLTDTFNCYAFGNGVESYKIQDSLTGKTFSIDSNANDVNKEGYRQIRRFKDITYSGVFNSNTNLNRLNEFNLSLANFKEDIEAQYGPIYKIKGQDTNLEVYQEDKDSIVYYEKDFLFNADGTTNLSRTDAVLGKGQKTYEGEYGISTHSDSFDEYGFTVYHTDVKRGVVIKKSVNGLFEASSQKMRSYFKNLFRNNTINHVNGKYDQYNDFYILNIQFNDNEFVTWVYSDKDNGWLGRLNFNPESMLRINNHFISFKNGEVYLHNQESIRNTFYGVQSDSVFSFNFSQEPSTRKSFKNIEVEGTIAPDVKLLTELNVGYINKADFERKEGDIFYAYVRNKNEVIDTALLSSQGIGNCTVSGLTLNFGFELDNVISVGDNIYNQNLQLVGTILSKTANSLILNTANNIVSGDYVLCQKPQSIQNNDLLGRYMKVTCRFSSNTLQEIFAVNSVISKSFV
jgi:hypothetical protein